MPRLVVQRRAPEVVEANTVLDCTVLVRLVQPLRRPKVPIRLRVASAHLNVLVRKEVLYIPCTVSTSCSIDCRRMYDRRVKPSGFGPSN